MSDCVELVNKFRNKTVEIVKSRAKIVFDTSERNDFDKEPNIWTSQHVEIPEIDAFWCINLKTSLTWNYKSSRNEENTQWTCELFINNEEIVKSGSYTAGFQRRQIDCYEEHKRGYDNYNIITKLINSKHIIGITSEPFSYYRYEKRYEFLIEVTVVFRGEIFDAKHTKLATPSPRNWILDTQKLFDSSELSDFTYKVKDKEFKVHKLILSLASPVFKNTFSCGLDETKNNTAIINDCDPEMFQHLLAFIYKGILPKNLSEVVVDLYELAHLYQVELLQKFCYGHIMSIEIKEQNALDLYEFAKKFDLKELHSNCWTYIKFKVLKIHTPLNRDPYTVQEVEEILKAESELSEVLSQAKEKLTQLKITIAEKLSTSTEAELNPNEDAEDQMRDQTST